MCEGNANHPDLRLPLTILWEIPGTSYYDKGGTHPTAVLPRPHISKGQFADPSNHPRSFPYIWGSENAGANAETSAELWGLPASVRTSNSRTHTAKLSVNRCRCTEPRGMISLPCGMTE